MCTFIACDILMLISEKAISFSCLRIGFLTRKMTKQSRQSPMSDDEWVIFNVGKQSKDVNCFILKILVKNHREVINTTHTKKTLVIRAKHRPSDKLN